MFARVLSMGLLGIDAFPVQVEVDLSRGMPAFEVVGLPDAAVREARDRVRAVIKNCGLPAYTGRVVVNLAPAGVKKEGAVYDLPILLAVLQASGSLSCDLSGFAFAGELSLAGEVQPITGALSMAAQARAMGLRAIFLPQQNAAEGAVVEGLTVYGISTVPQLLAHLRGEEPLSPAAAPDTLPEAPSCGDFSEVRGQPFAKRALEIAAAGMHNALLIGSPGAGKSMLAQRLPSILPPLTFEESLEVTKIHSVAGLLPNGTSLLRQRPFRAPHHTVSPAGLSGGGSVPRPGEISLAHRGVLFLDELPEFSRSAMEALRQPLEEHAVTIVRVAGQLTFPSAFMLIAAMNPCPCGFLGHPTRSCSCAPGAAARYRRRISGPLLDRIDLHVEVLPVEYDALTGTGREEPSAAILERVQAARLRQEERYRGTGIHCNAHLTPALLREACRLSPAASELLRSAFERLDLSARAYDRILKVARTIADLEGQADILPGHIAEAIQYRSLDRKYWEG